MSGSSLLDALVATDEQIQLADAVARFVRDRYDYRAWRSIVDADPGICQERWAEMAELGWLGVGVPEAAGGFGTLFDALQIVETLATGLAAEPLANTVVVCADLLARAGSDAQRARWLPPLIEGRTRWALAHDERHSAGVESNIVTCARAVSAGWELAGGKWVVADAPHSDHLIVSARIEGESEGPEGLTLFILPTRSNGLTLDAMRSFDRRRVANLTFQSVVVPGESILGEPGKASALLERAHRRQVAALAAEAVGLAGYLLRSTREYLSGREQFGARLASFQVLQHRLVDMAIAFEELRTAAKLAAISCEAGNDAATMVAAAAVTVARDGRLIGRQAIQLHGGMGMTDDLPVGDFMKRLEAIALRIGPDEPHLDRVAMAASATRAGGP